MYRYFVLVWDPEIPEKTLAASDLAHRLTLASSDWSEVVSAPGLRAFHAGFGGPDATSRDRVTFCETRAFADNGGLIFGRAFELGHETEAHDYGAPLPESECQRVRRTKGMHLLTRYWGRYVALFRDLDGRGVSVLRDPTGGLPCFYAEVDGVQLIFPEIESVLSLKRLKVSINWRYLAAFVPYSGLQIAETGLNEVKEVQPGQRVDFTPAPTSSVLLWRPAEIAATNRIKEPIVAVAAVRETVKQCVNAWASLHRSVVHNLSGGLDSSIVLSCLMTAPSHPKVTCLHYYAPESAEDERKYARLVARHLNAELVECALDPAAARLERLLEIRPTPRPWFYTYDLVHSPVEARVMREAGATALFSGAGGDGLFIQARTDLAVADYLRHHGISPGLFGVALNAARINRTSIWTTLQEGFLRHWRRPSQNVMAEFADRRSLIPVEVFEAARNDDSLFHIWIRESPVAFTPGLMWQILCMALPMPFYESFGGVTELERTPVLVSQPLMELCLRIPSYVWITGARDRSIARRAFADVLPQAIVRRTQKGLIDRYNRRVLDVNAQFIREMLVDGYLVRAGLLDRERVAASIHAEASETSFEYNEVLRQHLSTEVWVRRWEALTTSSGR